jgi:hypothetical protein
MRFIVPPLGEVLEQSGLNPYLLRPPGIIIAQLEAQRR